MNMRVNTRLIVVLVLVLAVFMSFSVGFAQDEGGDTSTEPAGVGEIAKTADNFNVSAVPTQEQAQDLVNAPEGTEQLGLEDAELLRQVGPKAFAEIQQVQKSITPDLFKRSNAIMKAMPPRQTPPGDVLVQVTDDTGSFLTVFTDYSVVATDVQGSVFFQRSNAIMKAMPPRQTPPGDVLVQVTDDTGSFLTVFTDYSVVATDVQGSVFFQGYIVGESAATLMIVGHDADGNQYAVSNGDVIGLTATNVVFLGSGDHFYFYVYKEDGNFAGLFDSDDNHYAVETTDDGGFTITDPAGDIGDFNPDGSYDIKDPAGAVLDQGALFGENDDDSVSSLDAGGDATLTTDAEATEGSLDANSSGEADATIAPDNSGVRVR